MNKYKIIQWLVEKAEEAENKGMDMFITYSAHVNVVHVYIYVDKWGAYKEPNVDIELLFNRESIEDVDKKLEEVSRVINEKKD